jgi:hypothetical protein
VITVLSVIAALTDRVPELKNFETFGWSIEKIETLGVKLKIATNFVGGTVIFPIFFLISLSPLTPVCVIVRTPANIPVRLMIGRWMSSLYFLIYCYSFRLGRGVEDKLC